MPVKGRDAACSSAGKIAVRAPALSQSSSRGVCGDAQVSSPPCNLESEAHPTPVLGSIPPESRPDSQQAIGEDDWTCQYRMSTYSKMGKPPESLSRYKGQHSEASSRVARSPRSPQPLWARSPPGPTSTQNTPIPAQHMWFPSRSEK